MVPSLPVRGNNNFDNCLAVSFRMSLIISYDQVILLLRLFCKEVHRMFTKGHKHIPSSIIFNSQNLKQLQCSSTAKCLSEM